MILFVTLLGSFRSGTWNRADSRIKSSRALNGATSTFSILNTLAKQRRTEVRSVLLRLEIEDEIHLVPAGARHDRRKQVSLNIIVLTRLYPLKHGFEVVVPVIKTDTFVKIKYFANIKTLTRRLT